MLLILDTSLQLSPAYSEHWEFREMTCENHGRINMPSRNYLTAAFHRGFAFGHLRSLSDLDEQSHTFQLIFKLLHEVINVETKVPRRFGHSEYFFYVHVFCRQIRLILHRRMWRNLACVVYLMF